MAETGIKASLAYMDFPIINEKIGVVRDHVILQSLTGSTEGRPRPAYSGAIRP